MAELFQLRLSRYQKKLFRYLKYVFNDHMSLLLLFLVGGFVFYYTEFIKVIAEHPLMIKVLVGFIWLGALSIGRLATLVEEADKVFLLPKEKEISRYLNQAFKHSLMLPMFVIVLVVALSGPLLLTDASQTFIGLSPFLFMMLAFKFSHLQLQQQALYQLPAKQKKTATRNLWLIAVLFIGLGLLFNPVLAMCGSLGWVLSFNKETKRILAQGIFDWDQAIKAENSRQKKIYQFINLFTDVPGIKSQVKRRSYFDGLITKVTKNDKNPYVYLFARSFVRGNEFSGMFVRLLLVAIVMLWFAKSLYMALPISLVAIFLIGFQLIPMYHQFDYMVMTQLYPVPDSQKQKGLQKVMAVLLLLAAVILAIVLAITVNGLANKGLAVAATIAFSLVLSYLYVPLRLKK
ncbi:ABC transporter permease [Vagococcus zengguangii]|uniref:ABC transporter permease n=1 Tax=Vagococcus zengguangii TaxID=2571750 RepID=A0A4D7CY07_9ENTE|nr:ABC transporter permease [Vagococcus zengguangii]QCI86800.1 ABC transporter permease [Vagococcus zengguangii]TLG80406.1 ABC transporter permease [Vagococcus zengguangii]